MFRLTNRLQFAAIRSLLILSSISVFFSACDNGDDPEESIKLVLEATRFSDPQINLNWTKIPGVENYELWRVDNENGISAKKLVSTAGNLFPDTYPPQSTSLSYYVTATLDGKEIKSNVAEISGSTFLSIVPLQMEVVPGTTLALVREKYGMAVIDYEQKVLLKKESFIAPVGRFVLATHNGVVEAYVPDAAGRVFIMNPTNLNIIDGFAISEPITSVAVTSNGDIYCANQFNAQEIIIYNRNDVDGQAKGRLTASAKCNLYLRDDNYLLALTTDVSPSKLHYLNIGDEEAASTVQEVLGGKYTFEDFSAVSAKYFVTSRHGHVYKVGEEIGFLSTLPDNGGAYTGFEFDGDSRVIAAVGDQKVIKRIPILEGGAGGITFEMVTQGYPRVMARADRTLIVLSSPAPVDFENLKYDVRLEKISLPN